MDDMNRRLPEGTYIELVRSAYSTLLPTAIMSLAFLAVGLRISSETPDQFLRIAIALGAAASVARILVLVVQDRRVADETLDADNAKLLERQFAVTYVFFAVILGAFGARAFAIATPEGHALVVGLLSGYGAGVAAGLSLRPWISVPSILIAIVPTSVSTRFMANPTVWMVGALLAAFLAGGVESMLRRYRSETRKITMRRLFASLARHDHLTGLSNRLALRERFEGFAERIDGSEMIAVHCLDLDRFKPVNDQLGHPMGDEVLKAVSHRLENLLRRSDFAARIGGDEFVIIQIGAKHAGEAEMLARRVVRAIAQPYLIDGHEIVVGVSVGYALSSEAGYELDRLLDCADGALYRVKRAGGGVACCHGEPPSKPKRLTG